MVSLLQIAEDFSMWLSVDSSTAPGISGVNNIKSHIGRCVVCSD